MPAEFSLAGVYLPGGIALLLMLLPLFALSDRLLLRSGLYSWLWHPSLCRMALFIALYSLFYTVLLG